MLPLAAIRYILISGVLVLSFFFGMRFLFASDFRREAWRSALKHRIYMRQPVFKRTTIFLGWICLLISLFVAYFLVLDFLED